MQESKALKIRPPHLHPKFTNIGYGNPRYNSMVVCPDASVLISCGPTLRKVDIKNDCVLFSQQIGCSQIFQIIQNQSLIMVINFDGFISLLKKDSLQIVKQFYAAGKEIRHSSIDQKFIAISCELNDGIKQSILEIYSLEQILNTPPTAENSTIINIKPLHSQVGYFYYPQLIHGDSLIFIEHHDPNPKGRSRTETVMNKKLPVQHKIHRMSLLDYQAKKIYDIEFEGEILSASKNIVSDEIYYLHQNKRITRICLKTMKCQELPIVASSAPHCLEAYKDGLIYCSKSSELTYITFKDEQPIVSHIPIKSEGVSGNFSIKTAQSELKSHHSHFYLFNEYGLHYYCADSKKTYSQNCFDITNCGVSLNKDGSFFAVADFGGNVYTFTTDQTNIVPMPTGRVSTGIPVRTLVWCHETNKIVIGCVGGTLFSWDCISPEANFVTQLDHTINILRYYERFVLMGTSDGYVHILDEQTMEELYKFQAHFPIQYETEVDRQLFGSMKNYAEVWSITTYQGEPHNKIEGFDEFHVVTCCQDQSQKVFVIRIQQSTGSFQHQQLHHLKGHTLAVTSIDWKNMGKQLGEVYVSCSDDKVVRFRDPKKSFEVVYQLETSTIKEWHTLTYLALEPNGHRVAIGSQNGYLFIFDIATKEMVFGEKIHLGGIEGMDWVGSKLVTCSSDLCLSVATI